MFSMFGTITLLGHFYIVAYFEASTFETRLSPCQNLHLSVLPPLAQKASKIWASPGPTDNGQADPFIAREQEGRGLAKNLQLNNAEQPAD